MTKKMLSFFMIVALLAGIMAACAPTTAPAPAPEPAQSAQPAPEPAPSAPEPPKEEAKPPIIIGSILDLSGNMAAAGKATQWGADYAAKLINDKGGINGRELKIIHYDVKGDPNEGITAYNRLVDQDKAVAVVGPGISNIGIALAPVAEEKKVPVVSHFMDERATTNEQTGKAWGYIFLAEPSCNQQAEAIAAYSVDKLGIKTVGILYDSSNAYSMTHAIPFRKYVESKGVTVVAEESFGADAKDYKAQLSKIIAKKPDGIFVPSYSQQNALAYVQARQLGFKGTMIGNNTYNSPFNDLVKGTKITDLYYIYNVDFDSEYTKFLGDAYMAANNGTRPLPNCAFGYDNVTIIANALTNASNPDDPVEVTKMIETKTVDLMTSSGPITIDPATHRPVGMGVYIAQWDEDGTKVTLLDYYKAE